MTSATSTTTTNNNKDFILSGHSFDKTPISYEGIKQ